MSATGDREEKERPESAHSLRDRFLSEFALSLAEEVEPSGLLSSTAEKLCGILDVDRVNVLLFEEREGAPSLVAHATYTREGLPPLPPGLSVVPLPHIASTLAAHRLLAVSDALEEMELAPQHELFRKLGTKSILLVPIVVTGELKGVVSAVTVRERREWASADVEFLESAVRHLSAALAQAELVGRFERERDRLAVLFDLASAIHRSATVPEVIETALAGLRERLGFPTGGVALVSPEGTELVKAGGFGTPEALEAYTRVSLKGEAGSLARLLLESSEPIVIADLETDPRAAFSSGRLRKAGARSIGFFPVRAAGNAVGILGVGCDGRTRRIEPEDVKTLQSLADIVGVALGQRRAAEALQRSAVEARSLSEASRALLTRTANRDLLLSQILDALVLQLGHEHVRLLLVDRERRELVEWGERGVPAVAHGRRALPLDGPGLTVAAVRDRAVVDVPDVTADPRYLPGWEAARSELAVPLVVDGEVVGVFDLQSERSGAFREDEIRLLTAFAERAGLALKLSDLVAELERRTRVLEAVARATQILSFRLHAPDVLASVVEEASRAFLSSDGSIAYVAGEDGKTLAIASAFGLGLATQGAHGNAPIAIDQLRCAGLAFRENRPVFLETAGLDDLMGGHPAEVRARVRMAVGNAEIRHLMAVPIRVGDQRLGVIEVLACRPKAFSDTDAETLALLADQAAIALRNARLIEELQRTNRMKDDFLANLSHEVRTPLTGIVGWAEVLLDARGEDPQTRRALTAILGQADTLSRMLSDLIDLSRIDHFGFEVVKTRVRLQESVAAALDAVAPTAKKRDVTIRCVLPPDLPALEGDPARMKQVVWNLLTNAVKFSSPGGSVEVTARWSRAEGVELSVSDMGSGIDPSFLPHVFERFRQEETATNRRFGGLGVGLAIVRAIVHAHGGTVWAHSEGRGRGTRFTVRFPKERLSISSTGLPKLQPTPPHGVPRPALLVVADDPAARERLTSLGESLGYEAEGIDASDEALSGAFHVLPDLVVVGFGQELEPGLRAVRRLRAVPGAGSVPSLAVGAQETETSRTRLLASGFSALVRAPGGAEELAQALRETLRRVPR